MEMAKDNRMMNIDSGKESIMRNMPQEIMRSEFHTENDTTLTVLLLNKFVPKVTLNDENPSENFPTTSKFYSASEKSDSDSPSTVNEERIVSVVNDTRLLTDKNSETSVIWMRNPGRKKSHPVWDFFKDLRNADGTGGVVCSHCSWRGDDRSPNNLKTHLKRFHDSDGIYQRFCSKLALTPTQPYVKRNRTVNSPANSTAESVNSVGSPSSCSQNNGVTYVKPPPANPEHSEEKTGIGFLSAIPQCSEVINITAAFSGDDERESVANQADGQILGNVYQETLEPKRKIKPPADHCNQTQICSLFSSSSENSLSVFTSNEFISKQLESRSMTHFLISDQNCAHVFLDIALKLDCQFSFFRSNGEFKAVFISNFSLRDDRKKELHITDEGTLIRLVEFVGSEELSRETWQKTDASQFLWAIRGKCQKVFGIVN